PESRNSLYFSLLAREFCGEGLARDCVLRQPVCTAEKSGKISPKIAGNGRNFATLTSKPDRRKCPAARQSQALWPFFSGGRISSPLSATPSGERNAITNRWFCESDHFGNGRQGQSLRLRG